MIDGTYFENKVCLIHRDNNVKATQLYRLSDAEWLNELREDLKNITSMGIHIESVICDGLSNIMKAVRRSTPSTIIWRCLAHIQRETFVWLTKNPHSEAGQALRPIVKQLPWVDDRVKWGYWVVEMFRWYEIHKAFLKQKTFFSETIRYWFTHRSVRRSFIHRGLITA